MDLETYVGLFAPRGTPRAVVTRLNQVLAEIMNDPATLADLQSQGAVEIKDHSADGFGQRMAADRDKWRRIVAFELARQRSKRLCSVEKSNVMESGKRWRAEVQRLGDEEFPDISLIHMYADNCAMQLVRNPRQFDVVLADNLFGDILSDCAVMVCGSLGMLPSASLSAPDETGRRNALYEPIYVSAPDIAGMGIANPLATILSFAMALRHSLSAPNEAVLLERAVDLALADGARTQDLAEPGKPVLSTSQMGDAVLSALDRLSAPR